MCYVKAIRGTRSLVWAELTKTQRRGDFGPTTPAFRAAEPEISLQNKYEIVNASALIETFKRKPEIGVLYLCLLGR